MPSNVRFVTTFSSFSWMCQGLIGATVSLPVSEV